MPFEGEKAGDVVKGLRVAARSMQPVVVAGLGATLRSAPGISFVAADDGRRFARLVSEGQLDVVAWHVDGPSADLTLALRQGSKKTAVVAVAEDSDLDGAGIVRLLRQGVMSVIAIASDLAALPQVCRDAVNGHPYISPSFIARMVFHFHGVGIQAVAYSSFGLTHRELEVLGRLTRGASLQEIAIDLMIETRTVRYHLEQLYRKLNVSSRHQAVAIAYQQGLAV